MSATRYARKKMLDDITGVAPATWSDLYLSAHTDDPTASGSHAFEVTGGGYVRQPLAGVMGEADPEGFSVNTRLITFGPATDDGWGTVTYLGVEEALSGGNMVSPGVPSTPRTINAGQPLQIPVGQLRLRIT